MVTWPIKDSKGVTGMDNDNNELDPNVMNEEKLTELLNGIDEFINNKPLDSDTSNQIQFILEKTELFKYCDIENNKPNSVCKRVQTYIDEYHVQPID